MDTKSINQINQFLSADGETAITDREIEMVEGIFCDIGNDYINPATAVDFIEKERNIWKSTIAEVRGTN